MTGSDKENHVTDGSSVPDMLQCSVADSAVVTLPCTSLSGAAKASIPVTSSRCTPVISSTGLPAGNATGDVVTGIMRFVPVIVRTAEDFHLWINVESCIKYVQLFIKSCTLEQILLRQAQPPTVSGIESEQQLTGCEMAGCAVVC